MIQLYSGLSIRRIAPYRGKTPTAISRARDRATARIAGGVRPGQRDMRHWKPIHGSDGLTPLQREVMRLRATGRSYRWIAVNLKGHKSARPDYAASNMCHQSVWRIHQRALHRLAG